MKYHKEVLDEISLEKKFESLTCQHEDCAKKANHFIMTEKGEKRQMLLQSKDMMSIHQDNWSL